MSPKNQPRQPHIIYKASRSLKVNPQVEPCQAKTYQKYKRTNENTAGNQPKSIKSRSHEPKIVPQQTRASRNHQKNQPSKQPQNNQKSSKSIQGYPKIAFYQMKSYQIQPTNNQTHPKINEQASKSTTVNAEIAFV